MEGEESLGHAPVLTPAGVAQPDDIGPGDACAVRLNGGPNQTEAGTYVHVSAENNCIGGVGVTFEEIAAELWKKQGEGEQDRGSERNSRYGYGAIEATHYASCDGPHNQDWRWKAVAFGYAVVDGTGYGETPH